MWNRFKKFFCCVSKKKDESRRLINPLKEVSMDVVSITGVRLECKASSYGDLLKNPHIYSFMGTCIYEAQLSVNGEASGCRLSNFSPRMLERQLPTGCCVTIKRKCKQSHR